jgi:glycosyltransferase involved in cell wall biosynthesis
MNNNTKLLFGHDHVFYKDENGDQYSGGGLPSKTWQRYLNIFDEVTVLGREGGKVNSNQLSGLALSSRDQVSFSLINSVSTIKTKLLGDIEVTKHIKYLVSQHDAVIARLSSEIGLLLVKESIKQNKPYAIELVDCPFDALWNYGGLKAKLYAPFLAWQVHHAMSNSTHALYVTKFFLQKRYPSPNALTIDCSNVCIDKLDCNVFAKRQARISNINVPVLGLVGSLHGRLKGIDTAIQTVANLKSRNIKVMLRVLGSGDATPFKGVAKRLGIADQIFFDGSLSAGEAVMSWLDCIDIYIHPSLKEGLPRALIEAMSRGCPCVATRIAGIPELLDDDFLINKKDSLALANCIVKLVEDPLLMNAQSQRNFKVSEDYHVTKLDKKRNAFWRSFSSSISEVGHGT